MYRDNEDIVREFWNASLRNQWEDFDWSEAFEMFNNVLHYKLQEHGYLGPDEYYEYMSGLISFNGKDLPYWTTINNDWVSVSPMDIYNVILELHCKAYREQLPSTFDDLEDLYKRVESAKNDLSSLELKEKIALYDECIHAQHASGAILEDIDIEDLRFDAERQWEEEQKQERCVSIREIRNSPNYI